MSDKDLVKNFMFKGHKLMWSGTGCYVMRAPEEYKRPKIAGTYVKYHRWRMEQLLGRALRKNEVVVFKDGNPRNVRDSNLLLLNRKHFQSWIQSRRVLECKCERCGVLFDVAPSRKRKNDGKYCSWSCRYPNSKRRVSSGRTRRLERAFENPVFKGTGDRKGTTRARAARRRA